MFSATLNAPQVFTADKHHSKLTNVDQFSWHSIHLKRTKQFDDKLLVTIRLALQPDSIPPDTDQQVLINQWREKYSDGRELFTVKLVNQIDENKIIQDDANHDAQAVQVQWHKEKELKVKIRFNCTSEQLYPGSRFVLSVDFYSKSTKSSTKLVTQIQLYSPDGADAANDSMEKISDVTEFIPEGELPLLPPATNVQKPPQQELDLFWPVAFLVIAITIIFAWKVFTDNHSLKNAHCLLPIHTLSIAQLNELNRMPGSIRSKRWLEVPKSSMNDDCTALLNFDNLTYTGPEVPSDNDYIGYTARHLSGRYMWNKLKIADESEEKHYDLLINENKEHWFAAVPEIKFQLNPSSRYIFKTDLLIQMHEALRKRTDPSLLIDFKAFRSSSSRILDLIRVNQYRVSLIWEWTDGNRNQTDLVLPLKLGNGFQSSRHDCELLRFRAHTQIKEIKKSSGQITVKNSKISDFFIYNGPVDVDCKAKLDKSLALFKKI